jgi:hypothetical protein
MPTTLPRLPTLDEVADRLAVIFDQSFPDRAILVGEMARRLFFVCLYGGFIEGTNRYFRPSTVIRFSLEQAAKVSDEERLAWLSVCQAAGFQPTGTPWYKDNTREPVRDDLIRQRALPIGVVKKKEGVSVTSPAPIYQMAASFAALFDPATEGVELEQAIKAWQDKHLDTLTLKRMKLLAAGVKAKEGQVVVTLPTTGKVLRMGAGEASAITKAVCEELAPRLFAEPVVVHVSHSDKKMYDELKGEADALDLKIDMATDLPDVVIADVSGKAHMLAFVEVVHTDGPITELRAKRLLQIAAAAGIPAKKVLMLTAFEDRGSPAFKKRVSELARDSAVWFASEPDMVLRFDMLPGKAGD